MEIWSTRKLRLNSTVFILFRTLINNMSAYLFIIIYNYNLSGGMGAWISRNACVNLKGVYFKRWKRVFLGIRRRTLTLIDSRDQNHYHNVQTKCSHSSLLSPVAVIAIAMTGAKKRATNSIVANFQGFSQATQPFRNFAAYLSATIPPDR